MLVHLKPTRQAAARCFAGMTRCLGPWLPYAAYTGSPSCSAGSRLGKACFELVAAAMMGLDGERREKEDARLAELD
jgi:hypothetical protein